MKNGSRPLKFLRSEAENSMRIPLLFLIALTTSACVANKPFRSQISIYPPVPVEQPYTLAFIEFDDMGEFWDRRQFDRALNAIRQAKVAGHGQAIVVTFVHGWKNNSSDKSGNVWGFREQLRQIVGYYRGFTDIPVVGIYIGWRGSVTDIPLVKQFTFYNRRAAAIRIPGASLTETLHQIMRVSKSDEHDRSVCVLIGHSFGGMVLERALSQSKVSLINN